MIIVVGCAIYNISGLVQIKVIDSKIEMYQEENKRIEDRIEAVVKQYQEYESGIFVELVDNDSYITLVSLYPELKADNLIQKQIEVYLNNYEIMVALKKQKINEGVYRWWLYFGE